MKFAYLYLVLSLVFTGFISDAQAATQAGPVTAAISKIDGDGIAKVRRKSGVESVAGVNQELFTGDRISTDARSIVEIMLSDGTLVRIGLNSEYRLESVEKKSGIFSWVFGLAKGSIRAMVEKNPKKDMVKFRVNTPVGTMGVRGTELVLDHNEKRKRTTLHTIEGRVEFGSKGCYLKRRCIEVKTGETASMGENQAEQPVAKPAGAASVFLMDGAQKNRDGSMEAFGDDERLARAALFTSMKNAENLKNNTSVGLDAKSGGDINQILKEASEAMADAQDKLIGRTKAEREGMEKAIKDGSYADRLKLAEKFDDLRDGSGGKGKDREKENLDAAAVNRKLKLADAVLKSKKMHLALEKRIADDNDSIEAKLKAAQSNLSNARSKIQAEEAKVAAKTATATATSTSTSTATDFDGEDATAKAAVEEAVKKLDKPLVDAILKDQTVDVATTTYSYEDKDCFMFICVTDTETRTAALETENTRVERKSGVCYETKKNCKREMIPCNLKNGKSCKPSFTNYACTETKIQISCPANAQPINNSGSGSGSGINSGYPGGDR
jgi:hypothetical protein